MHKSFQHSFLYIQVYAIIVKNNRDNKKEQENKDSEKSEDSKDGKGKGDKKGNNGKEENKPVAGEVRDATKDNGEKLSDAEIKQKEGEWKIAVKQAAQQAKAIGDAPANLLEVIDEVLEPKIDWREALNIFVDQTAKSDYTWTKPNRRFIASGMYLPSLASEELKPIVIAIDTSLSIGREELAQFGAEINSILSAFRTTVHVIYCDTRVTDVIEVSSDDLPYTFEYKGRGGTRFSPVFIVSIIFNDDCINLNIKE